VENHRELKAVLRQSLAGLVAYRSYRYSISLYI